MKNVLWYNKPATDWNSALPIGNGKLGAMIFGGIYSEQVQINEETLWSGYYEDVENPDVKVCLPELQKLIFEKKYTEAQQLCNKYLVCKGEGSRTANKNGHYGSYQTAGELYIENKCGKIENYKRTLDLDNGIATVEFDRCKREYFSSYKYNVIVIIITGNTQNLSFHYQRNDTFEPTEISYSENTITVNGSHHDGKGENYSVLVKKVDTDNGCVIYITASTDYADKTPPAKRCEETMNVALAADINDIKKEHIEYFNKYMGRVNIDLHAENRDDVTTDERICTPETDKGIIPVYFQFGRYLLISSSRGVLPANLQGIWCKDYVAPWNSDYHININIQMNYWPAETTGLSEFAQPFFDYIQKLSEWGKKTAEKTYGCRGWVAHTVTNPWGFTTLGEHPSWGAFMCAGAWCCRHIWEHYLFTGDTEFLKKYYPVIKGSAQFFMDFLVKDPETGNMVTCPSNSPENSFIDPETGEAVAMSPGPTMDNSILYDLFSMTSKAADILGIDGEFAKHADKYRDMLPPLKIGKHGQLMEWIHDFDEAEPGHRHISNLYALHPSDRITYTKTPDLFNACTKTLERRLENGGGHTGWSRAWIVNFFARLKNGEKAVENVEALIRKSTQPNMFDSHPPFQIDGNFGGTAGIAEMLLQSHEGFVNVLPALPQKWSEGKFEGLVARGGFVVSCEWKDSKAISCTVESLYGNELSIEVNSIRYNMPTQKGMKYQII